MKTGNNKATNNYIVRLWSCHHYGVKLNNEHNFFKGQIQNVRTKEQLFFGTPAEFLKRLEKFYKQDEKVRN